MDKGRTPLTKWFLGIYLMGQGKRGRGTDQTPVIFGVTLVEKGRPVYLRANVCSCVDGDSLAEFTKAETVPVFVKTSKSVS